MPQVKALVPRQADQASRLPVARLRGAVGPAPKLKSMSQKAAPAVRTEINDEVVRIIKG